MTDAEESRIKKAKVKLARYCAYRERTQQEVRDKAYEIGLRKLEVETLISELIRDNFINEARFAKVYVSDKFRLNKWGRIKILHGLNQKQLSRRCIDIGLKELDELDYKGQLEELLQKKAATVDESLDVFVRRKKIVDYVIRKGYEPELSWSIAKRIL